jgi:hypothetical protein
MNGKAEISYFRGRNPYGVSAFIRVHLRLIFDK